MRRIQELKSEFRVIENLNLYNTDSRDFELLESNRDHLDFIEEIIDSKALESLEYMFLEAESGAYFVLKGKANLIMLMEINSLANFNKPILILKSKSTLHDLEKRKIA